MTRIVLAYSGGLETSVAIRWLAERYDAEVVTVTLDLGQGGELTAVRERALATGALRAHVIDAREELARDFILPALQAGALYEGRYPLARSLGRALIARRLVDVAQMERASAIAFGSALEVPVQALNPALRAISLEAVWGMPHADQIEYARVKSIAVPSGEDAVNPNANLWGRSVEYCAPADVWTEPPDGLYTLTRSPRECPDEPAFLTIELESGIPVRANGIEMPVLELIESLDIIAGAHGVGRIDGMEDGSGGLPRAVHEAPAAVLLHSAHRSLERFVVTRELDRLKLELARVYADLVHDGHWFSPAREAIDAFARSVQPRVTGAVRLKLFKGECRVVGSRSPFSQDGQVAPKEAGDCVEHAAAEGRMS